MLLVMTIVVIMLTLVLPAAQDMWEQRKVSDAQNTIRGLLMTGRARALRPGGEESGLLFYVDNRGTQRVVSIEQDATGNSDCKAACIENNEGDVCRNSCDAAWENVFRVTEDRQHRLPSPMRAVPRYVIESKGDNTEIFSAEELANNIFDPATSDGIEFDQAQRHRNYFTMIYSSDGRLLVRRDVLIRDDDLNSTNNDDRFGDLTGMTVGYDYAGNAADVLLFYSQDDNNPISIDSSDLPTSNLKAVPFLVIDVDDDVAVNFPSVDGLLVYDDALFNNLESDLDKRAFLLETAQPFYVSRMSGAVIRGPVGEAQ
jgi:type II secretory pathway pseudopilin PulG